MDDPLFAPPTENWQRISPKYGTVKAITSLIGWGLFTLVAVVVLVVWTPWWVALAAGLVLAGWTLWRVLRQPRLARSWGYAERDDDLYVTHGLWFKELTIVPYGRLQVANVSAGPIERSMGLASVELVTASAGTNASIPGLTSQAAAELRDRMTARAEGRSAGL